MPVSDKISQIQVDDNGIEELLRYVEVIRRRRPIVILFAVGFFFCASMVAYRLPNIYRSETVILVNAQQVPSSYVPSTVSTPLQDRLNTIQQQVMSPTRLKAMIDKLNLFPELRGRVPDEAIIQKIQKSTSVEVGGRFSSFKIAYQGEDPRQAAQIANELASTFIEENLKARQAQFEGTAEFLDNELQETKSKLEAREHQLESFKSSHVIDLPESKQFHLEALNNLRSQLEASQDRVRRAQQDKLMVQSMAGANPPTVELDSGLGGPASPLQTEIQKQETRIAELRSRYGPSFPDVRKAQAELDRLKQKDATEKAQTAQMPAVEVSPGPRSKRNPVIEAQIQKLDQEISEQQKAQALLQQQIDFHVSKLERVPIFEQQLADVMRDYDSLRAHYQNLLDKKLSAQMASELESRQKGEKFTILDTAPIPSQPYGPNRLLISIAGLIAGSIVGITLAVLLEMMDRSVRNTHEATQLLGIPVFAGIPQSYTQKEIRSRQIKFMLALLSTSSLALVLGAVISSISRKLGIG